MSTHLELAEAGVQYRGGCSAGAGRDPARAGALIVITLLTGPIKVAYYDAPR